MSAMIHHFYFREQLNNITSKLGKTLGFIIRNCKKFSNLSILTTLYYSLVRTRLEYCSLASFPYYTNKITMLETDQHRFLTSSGSIYSPSNKVNSTMKSCGSYRGKLSRWHLSYLTHSCSQIRALSIYYLHELSEHQMDSNLK